MSVIMDRADTFDPRTRAYAAGRSLLALATMSVLLWSPDHVLFTGTASHGYGPRCDGFGQAGMWCLTDGVPHGTSIARWVAVTVLAVVASGYRPRWTCLPHWYVTASLGLAIAVPNGGESAARLFTLLLVPMCLGDRRRWHWTPVRDGLTAGYRGMAYAAWWALRIQVAVIYLDAAGAKLADPGWRAGYAILSCFTNPNFGLTPAWRPIASAVLVWPPLIAALTWGVLATELSIAVLILGTGQARRIAWRLCAILHIGIVIGLGLFSFGALMIAGVLIAAAADRTTVTSARDHQPEPVHLAVLERV